MSSDDNLESDLSKTIRSALMLDLLLLMIYFLVVEPRLATRHLRRASDRVAG